MAISCFSVPNILRAQWKGVNNLLYFDERPLHFGFYLGINTMDYRFSHYPSVFDNPVFADPANDQIELNAREYIQKSAYRVEVYPPAPGFSVGGVANFRLGRDFDFRITPGMSLGSRHLTFSVPIDTRVLSANNSEDEYTYKNIPSYYIDLPLGIRYKGFRHYNVRPYVYLGGALRRDLAVKTISKSAIHPVKNSAYAEIAMGFDSYLQYFRFTGELRFSYGLTNVIKHDVNNTSIPAYYGFILKSLNPNIFTLIFYFE